MQFGFGRRSGLMQKPAAALFAEAVAVAPDGDPVAVVEQSVVDRGGDQTAVSLVKFAVSLLSPDERGPAATAFLAAA
jgi:hypothetical protein